jgi:dipeptidyl aminopeptidase/acylaminoacyl peptidase
MTRDFRLDPGFDPRIADWLEADVNQAPAAVLETVLSAVPSIPQRRSSWLPWRPTPMNRLLLAGAAIAAVVAIAVGGGLVTRPPGPGVGSTPSPTTGIAPSSSPTLVPGRADYSFMPGRILVEHLGNAIDGSEMPTSDYNPDTRRFYFMDPATMDGETAVEFLPGQPATGKSAADVSFDGRKVVFQDWTEQPRLYEANLDGTGFHEIEIDCTCQRLYPDYDPTATKLVYVRIEAGEAWLEIRDLETGETTPLESTRGPAGDNVPEQPAWSPDGTSIAFSRLVWDGRNDPIVGTVRYGDQPPVSGSIEIVDVAADEAREVPLLSGTLPGDVNWSPDGQTLVFSHGPASTTGSTGNMPEGVARSVKVDGTGFRSLPGWGGPAFIPDGSKILVQNNWFYLMNPDGSDLGPVKVQAMDLSDLAQGFVYIGHWIDEP